MFNNYVKTDTTPLYKDKTGNGTVCHLLWGDGVKVKEKGATRSKVTARGGRPGWVRNDALGGPSLLEFYFIDVGQGDGILIKTPNFRHIVIDGGNTRSQQDTGKNAADFIDWKFVKDYGKDRIDLDAVIASHCDADHYGGLRDLLDVTQSDELDAKGVRVEAFYHAGLSWWDTASGNATLGPSTSSGGERFWTRLLQDRSAAVQALGSGAGPKLHGWWAQFLQAVVDTRKKSGAATSIQRLSHADAYVPGFESNGSGEPAIRVLAPVEFELGGKSVLRKFPGGTAQNTNGLSLLLRVDYGRTRVLLTGDLNQASQRALLEDYVGERSEFASDVTKACHHGSEDISFEFLQSILPAATVISSGDNEGYDHPRPNVIAASAIAGYQQRNGDELLTPLIYSTEMARSVDLGEPDKLEQRDLNNTTTGTLAGAALKRALLHIKKARKDTVRMGNAKVVGGLIYGLINVRTDGNRILCATLDEQSSRWRIKSFTSRF